MKCLKVPVRVKLFVPESLVLPTFLIPGHLDLRPETRCISRMRSVSRCLSVRSSLHIDMEKHAPLSKSCIRKWQSFYLVPDLHGGRI